MYHNFLNKIDMDLKSVYKIKMAIPNTVCIEIKDRFIFIIGSLGKLQHKLHLYIDVQLDNFNNLTIYSKHSYVNNFSKSLIGTTRSLINSMIIGVTTGFIKKLQLVGIGYRVSVNNNVLNLIIGLSHPVNYVLPVEVKAQCLNQSEIILKSINKQVIGQVAADLRAIKSPEPFKGKGIRYIDELIFIKDTKKK